MRIVFFGAGYVGITTGACFAHLGHDVMLVDIDPSKIDSLSRGESPIYEPGLEDLLAQGIEAGRLQFTTDSQKAITHGEYLFIAVGTPSDEQGAADLQYVKAVARSIGQIMDEEKIIINKSTVPVGTAAEVNAIIENELQLRNKTISFSVVSNPEFLREGCAIDDFMRPDRIVVGADTSKALEKMRKLYQPLIQVAHRFVAMDTVSAELTKYAANAILATKISFINEMSRLAEKLGADIESVRTGITLDKRIGTHFLNPGCGYGGSCFPKDIRSLQQTAKQNNVSAPLLDAVELVNERQKQVLFAKINQHFNGDLQGKIIALWGLAFKPNTDDIRNATSLVLMEALWKAGARVQAYDPVAIPAIKAYYPSETALHCCDSKDSTLHSADALVIATEWEEFVSADFSQVKKMLRKPVLFDGRNIVEPSHMQELGFEYYAIGRGIV